MSDSEGSSRRQPWLWVPTLYLAEGIPYAVVMLISVVMYKRLGVSNADVAAYTSLLYLPWLIKPLWSPLVEQISTRRRWILAMQLALAAGLAGTAVAIPAQNFLLATVLLLSVTAVASATHDVAADGFYMLALDSHQQAWFVGVRSTFYRLAFIAGQGGLVMLAGLLEAASGPQPIGIHVETLVEQAATGKFESAQFEPGVADAKQQILAQRERVQLSTSGRPPGEVAQLIESIRRRNVNHGFYNAPSLKDDVSGAIKQQQSNWADALKDWLRQRSGPTQAAASSERVGDAAIVWLRIGRPIETGQQLVVQFGRVGGDASFAVVEGERFVATSENWNQPMAAVVQVDANVDHASSAEFEVRAGDVPFAWATTFYLIAGFFGLLAMYHTFAIPRPRADASRSLRGSNAFREAVSPFLSFFRKPSIAVIIAFLLLYRFAEAQLGKMATPFLLDPREDGGLALSTGEVGFVYGTVGVLMLTFGGLLGGFVAARNGLKFWLWWMVLAINLPNAAYLFLAYARPEDLTTITVAVAVEQFGYGFGFTAYMLYCLYVSRGEHETVHYALCTALMAAGMMLPGAVSGWLQEAIGYQRFFMWVLLSTIPSFLVAALIPLDSNYGKSTSEEHAP